MTMTLLIQTVSLFIFIVFISAISLQGRAKAILTAVYIIITIIIYILNDKGLLAPYLNQLLPTILIIGLPPLLAVAAGYWALVRYTLNHNRGRKLD